jgi:putative ABC transport system permease protein
MLDAIRADAVFSWRQLAKHRVASTAAVLSLALASGACTVAFRLIDALLLRPLPVASAERLFVLARSGIGPEGRAQTYDEWSYPLFCRLREALKGQAQLIAVSPSLPVDLLFSGGEEMEKAHLQYVSGTMFDAFGLRPSQGRLLTSDDDLHPGAHASAVLSFDYWGRRFDHDPRVIGRVFRLGDRLFEIVGVSGPAFSGTEPGSVVDIFVPTMMNSLVTRSDADWFRTFVQLKPGTAAGPTREKLGGIARAFQAERARGFVGESKESIDNYVNQKLSMERAAGGTSSMQKTYGRALGSLAFLVALVLLIACANVAILMTTQATARSRQMAVRISLGAPPWSMARLVLIECAWLACLASVLGGIFSAWAGPQVVRLINPAGSPALALPFDGRVLGFCLALTLVVMLLLGLAPALGAAAIRPALALKGGQEPRSRRLLIHVPVVAQVALCVLVLVVSSLFVATLDRLSRQPTGFAAEHLLLLDTLARSPLPPLAWEQAAGRLRQLPGIASVAIAGFPLLSGKAWNDSVSIDGGPPSVDLTYFLNVSPGWLDAMRILLRDGRDFRDSDTYPGAAIVNESFAKLYFHSRNPTGKSFVRTTDNGKPLRLQIVGLVPDSLYRRMREPHLPVVYVPLRAMSASGDQPIRNATFVVRRTGSTVVTSGALLRREVAAAQPALSVASVRTQEDLIRSQTVRERLLALLGSFFAVVALSISGVGLSGVLHHVVQQRRREIGIRRAIGAPGTSVARLVARGTFTMIVLGTIAGLGLGFLFMRTVEGLLYQVKVTNIGVLAVSTLAVLAVASCVAVAPLIKALTVDPVETMRAE